MELDNLTEDDLVRILTEPKNALIRQYVELLGTEGLEMNLRTTPSGDSEDSRVREQPDGEYRGQAALYRD